MLQQRRLGNEGLEVSAINLGTMMMPDNDESVRTIHGALDLGVTMFDTADLYGTEFLLGRFGEMRSLSDEHLKAAAIRLLLPPSSESHTGKVRKGIPPILKVC